LAKRLRARKGVQVIVRHLGLEALEHETVLAKSSL
jgi:hypothetical protein